MTRSGQVVLDDASSDKCLKVNADFRRRFVFGETGDEGYRSSCEDIPPVADCYVMLGDCVPGHSKWNFGKDRKTFSSRTWRTRSRGTRGEWLQHAGHQLCTVPLL